MPYPFAVQRKLRILGADTAALPPRGAGRGPVALLSLHSHRDRSFLDDVVLHELSGELRAAGLENELVVACVTDEDGPELPRLAEGLREFRLIVFERVWSVAILERLAAALPEAGWVQLRGEHVLRGAPALVECAPADLVAVVAHLLDREVPSELPRARPNLSPRYVADEDRPARPSYPIQGSAGCPYGADARENHLYEGVALPSGQGRGCAFCTTGNAYEHLRPADALASTLDQLRYVRGAAPSLDVLVLRDQNPFGYLTELVESAEQEQLGPFTLLIESRADWWLQNARRFERALAAAQRSSIRLAPFLVGIESFAQAELDRFNKGISAETNVRFLLQLRAWAEAFAPAMDLSHGAFGFILFTPWTSLTDLRENLEAIERTRLHELRGRILLSRARLYPDTALYYLAERDGLLVERFGSDAEDNSARYGYLPARPWRFADPVVARLSELAAELLEARGYRDELAVFRALLDVAERDPAALARATVEARLGQDDRRRALASLLVRAPELPVALPLFDAELRDLRVDGEAVVLEIARGTAVGRVRLTGPSAARVEPGADPTLAAVLPQIAGRLARSLTEARWGAARPLVRALGTRAQS
jgi:hypothetical protein